MKQSGGAETCTFLEEPVILSTYALHGWYYHKGLHPNSFLLGFVHSFIPSSIQFIDHGIQSEATAKDSGRDCRDSQKPATEYEGTF